ncbi:HTH_Tnp_Tc3_2 domain-containing protein [Trichonephila clavipes]|nr:HTH_Tnp_Tc3_2 domain-containing protein [Trichonephila clavipes]
MGERSPTSSFNINQGSASDMDVGDGVQMWLPYQPKVFYQEDIRRLVARKIAQFESNSKCITTSKNNVDESGRIVLYRYFGLSYRSIAAGVDRDFLTLSRIWIRGFQDVNTECRAGSKGPLITSRREDRHVTRMTLMDHAVTSRALSQELGLFARQQMSA